MTSQNELFDLPIPEAKDGKTCIKCNVKKPLDHFGPASGANYLRPECRKCTTKLNTIRKELREEYGSPPDGYDCPLCGRTELEVGSKGGRAGAFVIDHCHKTDKFRGWLCHNCNRAIGLFNDDVEMLKRAIDYLRGSP